ncbi:hypothetical protein [Microbacterium sp. gxy059]|uniref:hypothetical protein n=1 Tax=Microbacterium sp. gxy059 TaxID=2957199 RepID=UPI003D9A02F1
MAQEIHHIAIEDDWEMSRAYGLCEAATRGVPFEEEGFVHATTADRVQEIAAARYGDVSFRLLDIVLSVEELEAEGIAAAWVDGAPRVMAPIPLLPGVVVSEDTLRR